MPIIGLNGKRINDADTVSLEQMLKGSLENHIYHLKEWQANAGVMDEDPAFYDRILQHFRNGLDHLQEKINTAKEGNRQVKVQDLISSVYSEISAGVVNQLQTEDMSNNKIHTSVESFLSYEASDWGDTNLAKAYPNRNKLKIQTQDTEAGYKRTEEAFRFANEPMAGIDFLEDYDPAKESVAVLYGGRAGNSGTLKHTVEEYQEKLAGMQEGDPLYNSTKQNLEKAETARAGLIMGGEMARNRSVDLRNKNGVSFGDLYFILSDLNGTVMPKEKQGGKLRGFGIVSGKVNGSGSFVAPVNLYKTLSKIADGINQVKKVEDTALRKTRAIQLASFSYQMLVSEHVFPDANGRTSRLFADTILQTFGLPPHMPQKDKLIKTMGEPMDFNAGALGFYKGICQSENILREEREKEPLPKEGTPEDRQYLLSAIRKGIGLEGDQFRESEAYNNYIQAMEALDQRMEELGRTDEQGKEHSLTAEEKEDLLSKMVRVAETGEKFLDSGKEARKDLSKGIFGMISRLQTLISKDYDTVNEHKPEKPRSLKELQEDSRVVTIDLRNRNIKTLGHLTSTRIPMTIYGVNGKRRTGVFTKAVKTSVKEKYDAIVSKAARGCSPEAKAELMGIIPKMKQKFIETERKKYDDKPITENDSPEVVLGSFLVFGHGVRKKQGGARLSSDQIRQTLKLCNVKDEKIPDKAINVLTNGLNEMFGNPANILITASLELPDGARLDHRNSAMSVVAGLFGAGSLLVRSDNVRCIDQDGKVTDGTFMDFGKGIDLEGDKSLIKHLNDNPLAVKNNKNAVIRSLADLQIVDYLCLNADRHPGNILYQVDAAGNITGIQGIDNDSSFGRRRRGHMENLSLRVISKSMADKVMKTSPEMMRFALRGRGLTEEELSLSVKRLDDLKALIRNKTVRIVRDDKFADLRDDQMFPADRNNPSIIKKTLAYIRKAAGKRIDDHIPFEPYIERPVTLSKVSTTERKYTVGGMVDLSERAKKMITDRETGFDVTKINTFGRRSTEFTELLEAVRNVSNVPDFLRRSELKLFCQTKQLTN